MKSWENTKNNLQSVVQKKKTRRITPNLEFQARQNSLTLKELGFLDSLLKAQEQYPQLTHKQWQAFERICLKKHE